MWDISLSVWPRTYVSSPDYVLPPFLWIHTFMAEEEGTILARLIGGR